MKNSTAFILLFILIAVGGYILYGKNNISFQRQYQNMEVNDITGTEEAEKKLVVPSEPLTIFYTTENGFVPGVMNVKVGDTVTFVNQSDAGMWVASNPHPKHTGLSGFDEKAESKNGESYKYTFTKTGEFSYHNHVNPTKVGIIVVD